MPSEELDLAEIRKSTKNMIACLTHPEFVAAMQAVRHAPPDRRILEGSLRLRPEVLREKGVPLPDGMRISSRYFEEKFPLPGGVEYGDDAPGGVNLVNELNRVAPGVLDQLIQKASQSDGDSVDTKNIALTESLGQLIRSLIPSFVPAGDEKVNLGTHRPWGGCCGGGAALGCACCGC